MAYRPGSITWLPMQRCAIQVQNTTVAMGQATNTGPVLSLNQSWEAAFYLNYPGSIVTDPATGQWRMYYELIDSSAASVYCDGDQQ